MPIDYASVLQRSQGLVPPITVGKIYNQAKALAFQREQEQIKVAREEKRYQEKMELEREKVETAKQTAQLQQQNLVNQMRKRDLDAALKMWKAGFKASSIQKFFNNTPTGRENPQMFEDVKFPPNPPAKGGKGGGGGGGTPVPPTPTGRFIRGVDANTGEAYVLEMDAKGKEVRRWTREDYDQYRNSPDYAMLGVEQMTAQSLSGKEGNVPKTRAGAEIKRNVGLAAAWGEYDEAQRLQTLFVSPNTMVREIGSEIRSQRTADVATRGQDVREGGRQATQMDKFTMQRVDAAKTRFTNASKLVQASIQLGVDPKEAERARKELDEATREYQDAVQSAKPAEPAGPPPMETDQKGTTVIRNFFTDFGTGE